MPNRILKESICTSGNLNKLTPDEETFFYRLVVNCDDYGRFDARPVILRAKCFPLKIDIIKDEQIREWIGALVRHELVATYNVNGNPYLNILTWEHHQQVRAKRSKYPSPDEQVIASEIKGNHLQASEIKSSRNPIQSESLSESLSKGFEEFWKLYPKKKSKGDAERAFKKVNPNAELMAIILSAIERGKKSLDWLKEGGKYIPNPATWLNGKRWEDEYQEEQYGANRRDRLPARYPTPEEIIGTLD